jgi:hypothetical protein
MLSEAKHLKLAGPYASRAIDLEIESLASRTLSAALQLRCAQNDRIAAHEKKRTAHPIVMLSEAKHFWLTIN